jgi:hypothetical protein
MSVAHCVGLDSAPESRRIAEMWHRLCEHRARLNRLIVQGLPAQVMEDSLRKLEEGLRAAQERHSSPGSNAAMKNCFACPPRSDKPRSPRLAGLDHHVVCLGSRRIRMIAASFVISTVAAVLVGGIIAAKGAPAEAARRPSHDRLGKALT